MAAVVCVSSAVAGELLQDFKVGYILGGTPRTIQIVELIAVVVASLVMYFPLLWLHQGNINKGGIGFGDRALSAPQAGLMASLAQGIVGGDMAWPLVMAGIFFGIAMIMFKVRSPMLVAIGMYLPFGTTSAIFVGGVIRWITDSIRKRRALNEAQTARVENVGVLIASGLIAGEALAGLVTGWFNYKYGKLPAVFDRAVVPGGSRSHRGDRLHPGEGSAQQRGRPQRAGAAGGDNVDMRPADTSQEAWKVFLECQRRLTPSEKVRRAYELSDMLRRLNAAGIRLRYPQASEQEVFLRVTRQALGAELFRRAYGDAVTDERSRP